MKHAVAVLSLLGMIVFGLALQASAQDRPDICGQYPGYPGCTNNGGDGDGDGNGGDGTDNGDGGDGTDNGDGGDGTDNGGNGDGGSGGDGDAAVCTKTDDAFAEGYASGYADGLANKPLTAPTSSSYGEACKSAAVEGYLSGYKKGLAASPGDGGDGGGGIFTGGDGGGFGGGNVKYPGHYVPAKPGHDANSGGNDANKPDNAGATTTPAPSDKSGGLAMTGSGAASAVSLGLGLIGLGSVAFLASKRHSWSS